MYEAYLTTFDNPYDPSSDFEHWYMFDVLKGYNSCGLLGRFARVSDSLSDEENRNEIERAIDEIIKYDFENKFKKIKKKVA